MKLFLLLITLTFLLIGQKNLIAAETNRTGPYVTIGNVEAEPGSVVSVPITAYGFGDINGVQLHFTFNQEVLACVDTANVFFSGDFVMIYYNINNEDGKVSFNSTDYFYLQTVPDGQVILELEFEFCNDLEACALNETMSFVALSEEEYSYIFNGWTNYSLYSVNGSVFSPNPLRILTIEVEGQGNVLVNDEPYTEPLIAAENSEMQIEAVPDEGWQFHSWTGDLAGTQNPKTFSLMGDMNVTAVFSEDSNGDDDEVPDHLTLQGIQIEDGESECYDAMHTITVGGNPEDHYFIVKNGGEAWLIAGESIVLLPGTKVEQGGYLHASITTDESFCLRTNDTYHEKDDLITQYNQLPVNENNLLFRLYPNPASSYINIEFNNHIHELVENHVVEIYDIMGKKVRHITLPGAGTYNIDVSGMQSGMYILRAISGTQTAYERVIIR